MSQSKTSEPAFAGDRIDKVLYESVTEAVTVSAKKWFVKRSTGENVHTEYLNLLYLGGTVSLSVGSQGIYSRKSWFISTQ